MSFHVFLEHIGFILTIYEGNKLNLGMIYVTEVDGIGVAVPDRSVMYVAQLMSTSLVWLIHLPTVTLTQVCQGCHSYYNLWLCMNLVSQINPTSHEGCQ